MPKSIATIVFIALILIWIKALDFVRPILVQDTVFGSFFTNFGVIFFSCILAPIIEELIFRKTPMDMQRKLSREQG